MLLLGVKDEVKKGGGTERLGMTVCVLVTACGCVYCPRVCVRLAAVGVS